MFGPCSHLYSGGPFLPQRAIRTPQTLQRETQAVTDERLGNVWPLPDLRLTLFNILSRWIRALHLHFCQPWWAEPAAAHCVLWFTHTSQIGGISVNTWPVCIVRSSASPPCADFVPVSPPSHTVAPQHTGVIVQTLWEKVTNPAADSSSNIKLKLFTVRKHYRTDCLLLVFMWESTAENSSYLQKYKALEMLNKLVQDCCWET